MEIEAKDFDVKVLKSNLPVLVEFWAEWCGPCKAMQPQLEALAKQYAGKLSVYKLHAQQSAELANQHHVKNLPTLLLFKQGRVIWTHTGSLTQTVLLDLISMVK